VSTLGRGHAPKSAVPARLGLAAGRPRAAALVSQQRTRVVMSACCAFAVVACAEHHLAVEDETAGRSGGAAQEAGRAAQEAGRAAEKATMIGATAVAVLTSLDPNSDSDSAGLKVTATFTTTASGVDLALQMHGCAAKSEFPLFIKQGTDCNQATLRGPHWDSPRGEGIPSISCIGVSANGRKYYSRSNAHPRPWTIDGPAASDLVGHAMVALDSESLQPVACGVIGRDANIVQVALPPPDEGPPIEVRAQVAGLCLAKMIVHDGMNDCPNLEELVSCASEHCEVAACLKQCADFSACVGAAPDVCAASFTCPIDKACAGCQTSVQTCSIGFCAEQVACAPPVTPDGPCSQLEACCAMQPNDVAASCLETVLLIEKLSGDPSCRGVMQDWDTTAHLAVPCKFR